MADGEINRPDTSGLTAWNLRCLGLLSVGWDEIVDRGRVEAYSSSRSLDSLGETYLFSAAWLANHGPSERLRAVELRVIAGGDIMLGEHPAMVGRGTATRLSRVPDFDPLAAVQGILAGADLAIANLECALSDPPIWGLSSRRECLAPAAAIDCLAASGLHAVSLANNHIQQHGAQAVLNTIDILEKAGLVVVGLAGKRPGSCRPVELTIHGNRVTLLGYSLRPRQGFDEVPLYAEGTREGMLADIREARASGALVVVSVHWGDEFLHVPSIGQVELGRDMVDAGCNLVLGHHPHVLQGWELRGRGAIFYSLGNLVFDMPWLPELRRTALCDCKLDGDVCRDVVWHPLVIEQDFCSRPATGEDRAWINTFLAESRKGVESGTGAWAVQTASEYDSQLRAAVAGERWARNRYFLKNLHHYRLDVSSQLIGKFVLRRIGLLHD